MQKNSPTNKPDKPESSTPTPGTPTNVHKFKNGLNITAFENPSQDTIVNVRKENDTKSPENSDDEENNNAKLVNQVIDEALATNVAALLDALKTCQPKQNSNPAPRSKQKSNPEPNTLLKKVLAPKGPVTTYEDLKQIEQDWEAPKQKDMIPEYLKKNQEACPNDTFSTIPEENLPQETPADERFVNKMIEKVKKLNVNDYPCSAQIVNLKNGVVNAASSVSTSNPTVKNKRKRRSSMLPLLTLSKPSAVKTIDQFIGDCGTFINSQHDRDVLQNNLQDPKILQFHKITDSNFSDHHQIQNSAHVRSLVFSLKSSWFPDFFEEDTDELLRMNLYNQAINSITQFCQDIIRQCNPSKVFILIDDEKVNSRFGGILKLICHCNNWIAIDLNPIGEIRFSGEGAPEKYGDRKILWRKRVIKAMKAMKSDK